MHSFLPDTAVAKSHGFSGFGGSFRAAATVLFGAMLFGAGSMTLWLISAITAMRNAGVNRFATLVANLVFPFVFLLAAVHGQEIQGARYFVWCFWFSICWNLLELRRLEADGHSATNAAACAPAIFILCLLIVLPVESRLMYRVLTTRARTMRSFLATDLAPTLHKQLGVAADVGYISYYSQSNICDLSGLVNGRADALMSREQRLKNCAGEHPTFAFLNTNQVASVATVLNISSWRVCGVFDFGNLREPDRHYLLVAPQIADETCHATGYSIAPESSALTEAKYQ
jgi:hypothetical protein